MWNIAETIFINVTNVSTFEALAQEAKAALEETMKKDQKAAYIIFQAVEESLFFRISLAKHHMRHWIF